MKKLSALALAVGLALASTSLTHAWQSYLDGSALPTSPPWDPFANEGSTAIIDVGGGNFALRMDSPDHSGENPPTGTYYNEYYDTRFGDTDILAASRFRLAEFSPIGKETLLAATVGGATSVAPSITLVDGHYWVWSYTSHEPILDLGPAVANEWHEVYLLARADGTAKVAWDGAILIDGPVTDSPDFDGYVEFGSGAYWETNARTVIDFDWVGSGDSTDLIPEPGSISLTVIAGVGLLALRRRRIGQ
jgi:hypothetical protein